MDRGQARQQIPQRGEQGDDGRLGHRADGDRHDLARTQRVETELLPRRSATKGEIDATPRARRATQRGRDSDLGFREAGACQGVAQFRGLPATDGVEIPVLQGAAAAGAEMRAGRQNALGAWLQHDRLAGKAGAAGDELAGLDIFARQGKGQIERPALGIMRDAVPIGADRLDQCKDGGGQFDRGSRTQGAVRHPLSQSPCLISRRSGGGMTALRRLAVESLDRRGFGGAAARADQHEGRDIGPEAEHRRIALALLGGLGCRRLATGVAAMTLVPSTLGTRSLGAGRLDPRFHRCGFGGTPLAALAVLAG